MKKVTIFNIKGGVAKTVSTINIASILAHQNNKVLIIDLDPQSNATKSFNAYDFNGLSISDLLMQKEKDIELVIKNTEYENIDIVPANINLLQAEIDITKHSSIFQQGILKKLLSTVEDKYDYCLIDCPTYPNMLTSNALVASNMVIVPIKIDQFALDGLEYLMDYIEEIRSELNPGLKFGGCFITMYTSTNVNKIIKKDLEDLLGDLLYKTVIRQNVAVIESTFIQKPVIDYKRKCNASIDYTNLVKEVF